MEAPDGDEVWTAPKPLSATIWGTARLRAAPMKQKLPKRRWQTSWRWTIVRQKDDSMDMTLPGTSFTLLLVILGIVEYLSRLLIEQQ